MDTLEKGKQKLSEICDLLRKDTLEPAQSEAGQIIKSAQDQKEAIVKEAEDKAKHLIESAKADIEKERALFQSSLDLASKQCFEKLKESLVSGLFNDQLASFIHNGTKDAALMGNVINALVASLEKDGFNGDFELALSKEISQEEVCKHLVGHITDKLKTGEIKIESISGGAVVTLKDQKVSFDVSDEALKELLGSFLRKSFRDILFKNT